MMSGKSGQGCSQGQGQLALARGQASLVLQVPLIEHMLRLVDVASRGQPIGAGEKTQQANQKQQEHLA